MAALIPNEIQGVSRKVKNISCFLKRNSQYPGNVLPSTNWWSISNQLSDSNFQLIFFMRMISKFYWIKNNNDCFQLNFNEVTFGSKKNSSEVPSGFFDDVIGRFRRILVTSRRVSVDSKLKLMSLARRLSINATVCLKRHLLVYVRVDFAEALL